MNRPLPESKKKRQKEKENYHRYQITRVVYSQLVNITIQKFKICVNPFPSKRFPIDE